MVDRKTKTVTEAICYILQKFNRSISKMKIIKLLYLADKYHLLNYGRTITSDKFVAMRLGPVGSLALNVLDCNSDYLTEEAQEYIKEHIKISNKSYNRSVNKKFEDFQMLSESDKWSFDFIINKFGKMKAEDLSDYTHKYPEWKQYEDDFNNKYTVSEYIQTEELFSIIDDKLETPDDIIEISKDTFFNVYD